MFKSKKSVNKSDLPDDFDGMVRQAITLVKHRTGATTDEEFLSHLTRQGIEYRWAVEILLFLPAAFVRLWLPAAKWPENYIEYIDENTQLVKSYRDTKSWQIIWQVASEYFVNNPDKETVLKVGGRSAEFNAINSALMENPDARLEDLQITETVIVR